MNKIIILQSNNTKLSFLRNLPHPKHLKSWDVLTMGITMWGQGYGSYLKAHILVTQLLSRYNALQLSNYGHSYISTLTKFTHDNLAHISVKTMSS